MKKRKERLLFRFFSYFSGMNIDSDIFKIQSNNVLPSRGRILISEPFLRDATFGRSVIYWSIIRMKEVWDCYQQATAIVP